MNLLLVLSNSKHFASSTSDVACVVVLQNSPQVSTMKEGIDKVRDPQSDKFVYALGSEYAEYLVGVPPCQLTTIGKFSSTYTGFATLKTSWVKDRLEPAWKEMKGSGELDRMIEKWWKGPCHVSAADCLRAAYETTLTAVAVFGLLLPLVFVY